MQYLYKIVKYLSKNNTVYALLLSIFLGVMTDVYFGSIYGVYLFGYILFLALIDRFFKIFYKDHSMLFIIILASTLLLEVYVALIYGMLGFIQFDIIHFVVFRLLPTLIMNFVLLIMLYPLIIKFLKKTNNDIDMKRRQW
ncbi:rod shape-determining protein MreD [Staphylococcus aureus]|nr:rod shape-determining protein MreD [Staphylococcus aureus]